MIIIGFTGGPAGSVDQPITMANSAKPYVFRSPTSITLLLASKLQNDLAFSIKSQGEAQKVLQKFRLLATNLAHIVRYYTYPFYVFP